MANKYRGEVALVINGEPHTLCLTLGALAHLEEALGVSSLAELTEKLAGDTLRVETLMIVLEAALMGGGHCLSRQALSEAVISGGLSAAMKAVSRLFALTFAPETTSA